MPDVPGRETLKANFEHVPYGFEAKARSG